MLIVPSFVIVGLCSSMLQLYTGLGLYAVSTAFVVPCLTTLVAGYGETHQKVTQIFFKNSTITSITSTVMMLVSYSDLKGLILLR